MNKTLIKKKTSLKRVALRAILFSALLLLILAIIVEIVLFIYPTIDNYKREMDHEGAFALALIDKDYLERITKEVKDVYYNTPEEIRKDQYGDEYTTITRALVDDDFMKARSILGSCRESSELTNVYITFFDKEYERLVYIIDGNDRNYAFLPGMWISNENGRIDSPKIIEWTLSSDWFLPVTYGRAQGWTATDYIEICDTQGNPMAYMTINVAVNSFARQIKMFLALYIPVMIIVLIGFTVLAARGINKRLIIPINDLAEGARKYTLIGKVDRHVETDVFEGLGIDTGDELEELWHTMVDMEDDVTEAMRQIRDVTARQERLNTELDLAKSIQASALPSDFHKITEQKKFELFASMSPAKEVGGDFYDFFLIDDDHLGMVIADVSGKGVPAALFMMISKSLIKTRAKEGGKPSEILKFVNDSLCEDNINDMFVTVWMGILTVSTGEVVAANAGHEFPFVTGDDGRFEVFKDPHGIVIGAIDKSVYKDYTIRLSKGGKLFVYTDGVAEAQNEAEELFGIERITKSLNKFADADPESLVSSMKAEVDAYAGSAAQFDDITMLCLWYKG